MGQRFTDPSKNHLNQKSTPPTGAKGSVFSALD